MLRVRFPEWQYLTTKLTFSGWMSSLGWLASVTSSVFVVTTQIQAMINVTDAEYAFTNWQYTLIMLAFIIITIFFNTWGAKTLPMLETIALFGHLGGFLITLIPLWVLCSKNSAAAVFTEVVNNGGWSNTGTACLVSQVTVMYCNLGSDSVVHICKYCKQLGWQSRLTKLSAEEAENASLNVPRAMWWSYLGNAVMGTIMLITMLFCIGDLDNAIDSDAPFLVLFTNTGSTPVALLLSVVLFLLIFAGNITTLAATSRELWAFSRDRGFPFSRWISKVSSKERFDVYLSNWLACY
jgi:choline transport protein